jgi:hypothetical protein
MRSRDCHWGAEPQRPPARSVRVGAVTPETLALSFEDAIERGLRWNLGVLLTGETIRATDGLHQQRLSSLLPHLALTTSLNVQQLNVRAQEGIAFAANVPVQQASSCPGGVGSRHGPAAATQGAVREWPRRRRR